MTRLRRVRKISISMASLWALAGLAGCGGGAPGGAPTINIFPPSAQVAPGATVQFRTELENWSGGITWEVDGSNAGTIGADGRYTAPDTPGAYTVIARSVTRTDYTGHAVVVVGDELPAIDSAFRFTDSPIQPGVMTISDETGCIRGKFVTRDLQLVPGVALHLYRLTDAAGRAWENGEQVDFRLPARDGGGVTRQEGGNALETSRATTVSTGYGYYHEPTNNYTFGTTPPGYYLITFDAQLPDGRQGEVLGPVTRVVLGGDIVVNVFADQSPAANSAELQPGQTRPLRGQGAGHVIGKVSAGAPVPGFAFVVFNVDQFPGLGTFDSVAGTFTAGNVPGVFSIVSNRPERYFPTIGVAPVHIVGVRTQFDASLIDFDGGTATLSVAVVKGLEGSTAVPVPLAVTLEGPDNFAQTVAMAVGEQAATSFSPTGFTFPGDWQFFTGTVTLPENLTAAARTYTATVAATYGVAGKVTETTTIDVQGVDQPADPPAVRRR